MKKTLLLLLFLLFSVLVHAQMGIALGTTTSHARNWQIVTDNYLTHGRQDFLKFGTAVRIDFTFPLFNDFLEFQPAFNLSRITSSLTQYQNGITHYFELYTLGFQLNTNIYFLNINNPADDTKSNFSLKKGLFFQLSPSFDDIHMSYDYPETFQDGEAVVFHKMTSRQNEFNIGFRLGLHYQLTDLLSIAPLFGFRYYPSIHWERLTEIASDEKAEQSFNNSSIKQLSFGLRIGLHVRN